jgi:excisionase family DNA binding protein
MQMPDQNADGLFDLSDHPLLLSMEEVSAILRCSEQAVRRKLDRGDLAYVKDGRHIRIPREALRRYLAERLVTGPAHPAGEGGEP